MFSNKRKNQAVSEVLGTILLLSISVTIFSIVYTAFFSIQPDTTTPNSNIIGTIDNNTLILEHRGGDPLSLETGVILNLPGETNEYIKIGIEEFLDNESKNNCEWNIGERVAYPLNNLSNFNRFNPISITVVDKKSNSVIINGILQEARVSDLKIEISVSDNEPLINTDIIISIKVSNKNGPSDANNTFIRYILPSSLNYKYYSATQGTYNQNRGIWDVGNISVGSYTYLNITAKVAAFGINEITQFAILLDGSGSISSNSWELAIDGLASAIGNESAFPHDGTIELTLIQFGIPPKPNPHDIVCSRVEVGPVVVYEDNYNSIVNQIIALKNKQGKGNTPTASAIYLASDKLVNSNNFGGFNKNNKQIITLVTDGNANIYSNPGELCAINNINYSRGKYAASKARNYLLNKLLMTKNQDEIDVIAINPGAGHLPIDKNWLCDDIVWPEPCYDGVPPPDNDIGWPPPGPGWYRYVQNWTEFRNTIAGVFKILFGKIENYVELIDTSYMDPNSIDNTATVLIYPKS